MDTATELSQECTRPKLPESNIFITPEPDNNAGLKVIRNFKKQFPKYKIYIVPSELFAWYSDEIQYHSNLIYPEISSLSFFYPNIFRGEKTNYSENEKREWGDYVNRVTAKPHIGLMKLLPGFRNRLKSIQQR